MILELNHCLEEILRANNGVKTAADLATKYRKNVHYNLEATVGVVSGKPESDGDGVWKMYVFSRTTRLVLNCGNSKLDTLES